MLEKGKREITDFLNVKSFANQSIIANNIKICRTETYWDDVTGGRTPLYFTNWGNVKIDFTPVFETMELAELIHTSMTNREDSKIHRIVEQSRKIKNCVLRMGGRIYGKWGDTAITIYISLEGADKFKSGRAWKSAYFIDIFSFFFPLS